MKRFARLFGELDETVGTNDKVAALISYFQDTEPEDAVWALHFLCGRRPRRAVTITQLRTWCAELSGLPLWMFEECYEFVGDLAETIALLLPVPSASSDLPLHNWVENRILPLTNASDVEKRAAIGTAWNELNQRQRFVFNKLLTGGLRVGVSQKLVVRALAEVSGVSASVIAHRMMGHWQTTPAFFRQLLNADTSDTQASQPFPFCLAHSLAVHPTSGEQNPELLGDRNDWLVEWKWDGIRAQLLRRQGQMFLWSRGEELLTDRFPELQTAAAALPDGTVLDGEVIGWKDERVLSFNELQRRIGRTSPGKKVLSEVPIRFLAFDLLEESGQDVRALPLSQRRQRLEQLMHRIPDQRAAGIRRQGTLFDMHEDDGFPHNDARPHNDVGETSFGEQVAESPSTEIMHTIESGSLSAMPDNALPRFRFPNRSIVLSPLISAGSWEECRHLRSLSRTGGVEGLMLKSADSPYMPGRATGLWWKWKIEPYRCDAVLVYAQRGHGRRAGLYTDYTFAIWQDGQLVPFAKAYSGLTDEEIQQVDQFVQQNTLERFGPVRRVTPELVFELAFEGLQASNRHKSGIALRFPRINKWRTDKHPNDADSVESVLALTGSGSFNC